MYYIQLNLKKELVLAVHLVVIVVIAQRYYDYVIDKEVVRIAEDNRREKGLV